MNFYTEPVCAASKQGRLPIAWHAVVKMCWWFQSWLICSVDPTRVNKCPSRISLNQICTETVHCCKQEQLLTGEGPLSKRAISTVLTSQVHPLPPPQRVTRAGACVVFASKHSLSNCIRGFVLHVILQNKTEAWRTAEKCCPCTVSM